MIKYAVLDCGTNTFHLLIVSITEDKPWEVIYKNRKFIYLAEDGIHVIGPKAYKRALQALEEFATELQKHNLSGFRAVGTAAMRNAHNAADFINDARENFNINIEVISGEEEAHLIHIGVNHYAPPSEFPYLIMDIGGGSVEFILLNHQKLLWAKSFEVGVSVLFNNFQHSDPITDTDKTALWDFLKEQLTELASSISNFKNIALLGAAGTFDVIENFGGYKIPGTECTQVDLNDFYSISKQIQNMDLKTRLATPQIPPYRANMIIVALLLIEFVLQSGDITNIKIVMGDIKDGILLEMIV